MASKLVLAMDMIDVQNEYIDKLGDIWLNLNAIAQAQNWIMDVYIFRQLCPDIKQSGKTDVSSAHIEQALSAIKSQRSVKCSMLDKLAQLSEEESQDDWNKYLLIYIGNENNPTSHKKLITNTKNAYGVGLKFSKGAKVQLDTHYRKSWDEQNSQEELIKLGQWAMPDNFVDIIKNVKTNMCYMNDCGKDARCVEREDTFKCINACEEPGNCVGGACELDMVGGVATSGLLCGCFKGFVGGACSKDVDECIAEIEICQNGGICINHPGYYDCICKRGFSGQNCQIKEEHTVPQGLIIKAALKRGVVTERDLEGLSGLYERILDFDLVDKTHGLSYRPVYKKRESKTTLSFGSWKSAIIDGSPADIMGWKIGNFHQNSAKTVVYAFKEPTEPGFLKDFVDLNDNLIQLIITDAPRCTDQAFFCKNGGECIDGLCKCKSGFTGVQCENGKVKGVQPLQKAVKFKVKSDDELGLTGLYYRARDSCHADFIAKDLFAFKEQDQECKEIEGEIFYHCRKNLTIYQSKGMYLVAKVNVQSKLERIASATIAGNGPSKVAGTWMLQDGEKIEVAIEDTIACSAFSYCDVNGLDCQCIYGYQRSPVDNLCHEPKLRAVFIILFFSMGVILYMADYVQWFIREKFLPAIDIEDELEESFAFRERNEGDLDRAPVSKRRVVDMK